MRLICWNLWVHNPDQAQSVTNILEYTPDILCLQEVTKECLKYLQALEGWSCIVAPDFRKTKHGQTHEYYLCILSRKPILNAATQNAFTVDHLTSRSLWDRINRWEESIEFQYADCEFDNQKYRIFNVHLEVAGGPHLRLKQFEKVVEHFDNQATNLICGDFNIYAHPLINPLVGLMMGFSPADYFVNERQMFERVFKEHDMVNHFYGQVTYPQFSLQLDHILTPTTLKDVTPKVMSEIQGSDHLPIMMDIAF